MSANESNRTEAAIHRLSDFIVPVPAAYAPRRPTNSAAKGSTTRSLSPAFEPTVFFANSPHSMNAGTAANISKLAGNGESRAAPDPVLAAPPGSSPALRFDGCVLTGNGRHCDLKGEEAAIGSNGCWNEAGPNAARLDDHLDRAELPGGNPVKASCLGGARRR